jgi:hypothetical protein
MSPTEEIIYPDAAVLPAEPKTCITCKYLLGKRLPELVGNWKCAHPENILDNTINLVTGDTIITYKVSIFDARYKSYILREGERIGNDTFLCGYLGMYWEEYVLPSSNRELSNFTSPGGNKPIDSSTKEAISKFKSKRLSQIGMDDL